MSSLLNSSRHMLRSSLTWSLRKECAAIGSVFGLQNTFYSQRRFYAMQRRKRPRQKPFNPKPKTSVILDYFLEENQTPKSSDEKHTLLNSKEASELDFEIEEVAKEIESSLFVEQTELEDSDDEDNSGVQDIFSGPDPSIPITNVPCSGCGAMLHCQNPGIPGYIPSAKFKAVPVYRMKDSGMTCQRCFMLKKHNIALDASVSPDEYRKIIAQIHEV